MKKTFIIALLFANMSLHATISRLAEGITYCTNQYGANFKIDWKKNIIFLIYAGSDAYKIVKEVKNSQNDEQVFTARQYWGEEYLEFKLFSSSKGDFYRYWDKDKKVYPYKAARLSCWED